MDSSDFDDISLISSRCTNFSKNEGIFGLGSESDFWRFFDFDTQGDFSSFSDLDRQYDFWRFFDFETQSDFCSFSDLDRQYDFWRFFFCCTVTAVANAPPAIAKVMIDIKIFSPSFELLVRKVCLK